MEKTVQFTISEDVIEKFEIALMLNKENSNEVIESYMKQYISASFSNASQTYKDSTPIVAINPKNTMNSYTGKAKLRIPKWATRPEQNNHKIVRAYFQVENELGYVPLEVLEQRCSNQTDYPSTYVRDFRGNFNSMKTDTSQSHGKVFEMDNKNVLIWDYVKETLLEYKEYFCR